MVFQEQHIALATRILDQCREHDLRITTVESCTGGLIAACLTEIPGSSDVFDRGFVTYSNEAKMALVGVSEKLLETHGAVSDEVAQAMAKGALEHSNADIAVSVTGIAGPGGATETKPVGLVYTGYANTKTGETAAIKNHFSGDRSAVRLRTLETVLNILIEESQHG